MISKKPLPTQQFVLDLLSYDKDTGQFLYRKSTGRAFAGKVAGCVHQHRTSPHLSYIAIGIKKSFYKAHRLAWLYHYGVDPGNLEVDHIDGNGLNNRIENLRLCTSEENIQNRRIRQDNSTGFHGVDYMVKQQKYRARICQNGKLIHLGLFDTAEAAHEAHEAERKKLFTFSTDRHLPASPNPPKPAT